jgi:hypothetical protein
MSSPCPAHQHLTASQICDSTLSFAPGPDLPSPRDHHGTVLVETPQGAFLYVLGGTNYARVFKDVLVAKLDEAGMPGAWAQTRPMPGGNAGMGIAVHERRIYISAGQSLTTFPTQVYSTAVLDDGSLDEWRDEGTVPGGRFHSAAVVARGFYYVVGGVNETFIATDTIFRAPIGTDGKLGAFETRNLPSPRSHQSMLVIDNRLYISGGLEGNPRSVSKNLPEVLSADIGADGELSAFRVAGMLPGATPVAHANFEWKGWLYVIGGVDEIGDHLAPIRRARLIGDGTLSAFEDFPPGLPVGRSHVHQTPVYDGHLYTLGGSVEVMQTTGNAFVGTFE